MLRRGEPLLSNAAVEALHVQLKDRGLMHQPVAGGQGHARFAKDLPPLRERLIRSDAEASALVALGDELEEH